MITILIAHREVRLLVVGDRQVSPKGLKQAMPVKTVKVSTHLAKGVGIRPSVA